MKIHLHKDDLPEGLKFGPVLAIDTEAMGLDPHRDRLCLAQMTDDSEAVHIVQFAKGRYGAPRLRAVLEDARILKLFHFARFDICILKHYLGARTWPLYCTKIASKLSRTFTDRHGLKDLVKEFAGVDLSKIQQTSDWGAETLTQAQLEYAASDVIHLHTLKDALDKILSREGRTEFAQACFAYLPTRAEFDLLGWDGEQDPLAH